MIRSIAFLVALILLAISNLTMAVIPAKAGIQCLMRRRLGAGFRLAPE